MCLFMVVAVKIALLADIGNLLHLKPGKPCVLFSYQTNLSVFALQ